MDEVRERYRALTGETIKWLEEHEDVGLPDPVKMRGRFLNSVDGSHTVTIEGNVPLWIWKWMWMVMMCNWPGRGNGLAQAVLKVLVPLLCRVRGGVCYRTMIWVEPRE